VGLNLEDNELKGSIPPDLGNLASLEGLGLYGNELTGAIPSELGRLSRLRWLYLQGNRLTGAIPPELGNVGSFYATYNRLTGCIPANIEPSSINPQSGGVELERCPDGGIAAAGRKPRMPELDPR